MLEQLLNAFEVLLFGRDRPASHNVLLTAEGPESADVASSASTCKDERSSINEQDIDGDAASQPSSEPRTLDPAGRKVSHPLVKSQTVTSVTSLVHKLKDHASGPPSGWHPSIFQLRPLTGLLALGLSVCCVFAGLVILVVSDGQPEASWTLKPSVYLAIVAALSNSALIYARCQATPASWFYHASRGASVQSLERHWQVTNSLSGALINARNLSLLHVVCIVTSIVMIDGPLLQKASVVVPATVQRNITLDLVLPPELPTGFSGYFLNHDLWDTTIAAQLSLDWINGTPMKLQAPACKGSCKTTVQGPGLAQRNCTIQTWPITPQMLHDVNATWGPWKGYVVDALGDGQYSLPSFQVYLETPAAWQEHDRELIWLTVGLASWFALKGEYNQTTCAYAAAVVEYDVVIEDNGISLDDSSPEQGRLVRFANNTKNANLGLVTKKQPSTLDAMLYILQSFVNSNTSVALNSDGGAGSYYSPNPLTSNAVTMKHTNFSNGPLDLNYYDPTPSAISKFNQMMFRGALMSIGWPHLANLTDPDVSIYQNVAALETIQLNAYQTDLRWYAGAAVLELMTVLLILPMFWGWWTLGRKATFSPLDIALAFDSPLFASVNSASGANGVVSELGDMKLRYGVVHDQAHTTGYVPNMGGDDNVVDGRLGISTSESVSRPRKGTTFRL